MPTRYVCIVKVDEDQSALLLVQPVMRDDQDGGRESIDRSLLLLDTRSPSTGFDTAPPCGKYRVGSEQIKIQRPDRDNKMLKEHFAKVCWPRFTPNHQENVQCTVFVSICFTIYCSVKDKCPEIMLDPDFPEAMKALVSW